MSEATLTAETAEPVRLSEDWLAVVIGLGVFALGLLSVVGIDALGWVATTAVWTDPTTALAPVSKAYANLGGGASLVLTYLALTIVLSAAAAAIGVDVKRFALAFTLVFVIVRELVRRRLSASRRRHAGGGGEVRPLLVAKAHQRGRLHRRADRRPRHRQLFPAAC